MSNLYKLFDAFIEKEELIEEDLISLDFTDNMINTYLNDGIIEKINNIFTLGKNVYSLLFQYGIFLTKLDNYDKSLKCFNLLIKINPEESNSIIFHKFFTNVKRKNYIEALEYFNSKEIWNKNDYFFLYLLSIIIDLPEDYKYIANKFKKEFLIKHSDISQNSSIFLRAKVAALEGKYNKAIRLMYKKIGPKTKINGSDALIINLLKEAKIKKESLNSIMACLSEKSITNAIDIIKNYLNYIEKSEYLNLILSLIKLSYLEGDIAFIRPMYALISLKNGDYMINENNYLEMLYDTMENENTKEILIIKDIIDETNILKKTRNTQ